jgi:hypothetical protein
VGANFTPIQFEWFYSLEGDKTKFNWFLMETALECFFRIRDSETLAVYRKQYDDQHLAHFCAYYARRMKPSLLNCLRGRTKKIIHYKAYIDDFYPQHDEQLNRTLEDAAIEAWRYMLSSCGNCPEQCLSDYKARSYFFDEWKE